MRVLPENEKKSIAVNYHTFDMKNAKYWEKLEDKLPFPSTKNIESLSNISSQLTKFSIIILKR